MSEKRCYTVQELQEILGVSRPTIYNLLKKKEFRWIQLDGGKYRMRYRIEYADGRCCNFANSRKDLLDWLKALKDEKIVDIRKVYKNGVTDSVMDIYRRYLEK